VEQRNRRFKDAVAQSVLLRGSSDFESRELYGRFLDELFVELNRPRRKRFIEEVEVLGALPTRRVDACRRLKVRVRPGSTISVYKNVYSVHSRLRDEQVDVRLFHDRLEVYYAQRKVAEMPRLRGAGKHLIKYRDVIEWLVRKPGAFANYVYKADCFPTHRFRMAYDLISRSTTSERAASKRYLAILHLAACENEAAVDHALAVLIEQDQCPDATSVSRLVEAGCRIKEPLDIEIAPVQLVRYDSLLLQANRDTPAVEVGI
jgi:hypothetical protein